MANMFQGKKILVTGGTGSIGSEIVRKTLQYEPAVVRVLSNDEHGLFELQQELQNHPNVRFLVGDVRDKERLRRSMESMHLVFHAAALKHVPLCEYNPFEAIMVNALGTQNVIDVAMEKDVAKLINISTDKAVNPINVMGATKLLAERLTISANYYKGLRNTVFSSVRFGNVLDSRGSVVPVFREQIKKGGPVRITNPDMTRFVMTISQAVDLVLKAAELAQGSEIFIFKMSILRIEDLAKAMIDELAPRYGYNPKNIKVEIVGERTAEKKHEELLTDSEATNAYETEDMFIIAEKRENQERKTVPIKRYTSDNETPLTQEEIGEMLREDLPRLL